MKTFTYYVQCGPDYYSEQTDETFCDEKEIEYEVEHDELVDALAEMVFDNEFDSKDLELNAYQKKILTDSLRHFIINNNMEYDLADVYEDDLREYFRDAAIESMDD